MFTQKDLSVAFKCFAQVVTKKEQKSAERTKEPCFTF